MNSNTDRPLSPHLQIFHWKITMLTSVLHRASGIVLAAGSALVALWLCAAAVGPDAFSIINGVYSAWYGQIIMFCWSLVLFYHLCNGVRHLVWDFGVGFEIRTAETASYVVFGVAVVLTIIVWVYALIG